jgi:hypothetical protein
MNVILSEVVARAGASVTTESKDLYLNERSASQHLCVLRVLCG